MFASALHALGVAAVAGVTLLPGAVTPSAVTEFNTGVTWFGASTATVAPANSILLTPVYSVTGEPPADAVLGFTVTFPVGVTVESPGRTCTVDQAARTTACSSSADGSSPQLQVSVPAGAVPGTVLRLTARVNTLPGDAEPADDEATATVTVVPLGARIRVDGPASVPEGQTFAMQVVLFNDSDSAHSAELQGQVALEPGGGENLFTLVSLPPGCGTDPLSFFCEDATTVPPGGSRTFEFRVRTLHGAAGKVFTLLARNDPTEAGTIRDSADVRITAAGDAGPAAPEAPAPAGPVHSPAAEPVGTPAPTAELAATGAGSLPLTALGLALVVLGAALTRCRKVLDRR